MSLKKRLKKKAKRAVKSVKRVAKVAGREVQAVGAKVVKPVTAGLAAVGSFAFGPAAGAAIAGAGGLAARGLGATAARKKGIKGREARTKGRKLMKSTLKYGFMGAGAGVAGAGIAGAFGVVQGGGGILGGLTGGVGNIFGIGGGAPSPTEYTEYIGGEPEYMPPGAGTGEYTGDYYSGVTRYSASGIETAPGAGLGDVLTQALPLAGSIFGPKQQPAPEKEEGGFGGFFQNLFSTEPGKGIDLPVVGEVPPIVVFGGLAIAALAVARK